MAHRAVSKRLIEVAQRSGIGAEETPLGGVADGPLSIPEVRCMGDVADKGAPGQVDLAALERAIGLHTRLIATTHLPTQRVSSTRTDIPKKAAMVG